MKQINEQFHLFIKLWCFKHLSGWQFVTAATGNQNTKLVSTSVLWLPLFPQLFMWPAPPHSRLNSDVTSAWGTLPQVSMTLHHSFIFSNSPLELLEGTSPANMLTLKPLKIHIRLLTMGERTDKGVGPGGGPS